MFVLTADVLAMGHVKIFEIKRCSESIHHLLCTLRFHIIHLNSTDFKGELITFEGAPYQFVVI